MTAYIVRRILLIIPTLFAIMVINFVVIHIAQGGPVEQIIAQMTGFGEEITERVTRSGAAAKRLSKPLRRQNRHFPHRDTSKYRGAQGLDPEFIKELEIRFGFDKPLHVRFVDTLKNYLFFDFGESFFRDQKVTDLVLEKMPVSISLGIWTTLLVYLISIPLGVIKATRDGSSF